MRPFLRTLVYVMASLGLLGGMLFLWVMAVVFHRTSGEYLCWLLGVS